MRSNFRAVLLLTGAVSALAIGAGQAQAQQGQDSGAETQVDDIVVTAQLRQQSTIQVPFALTAYSGETLRDLGVQDFEALSAFVPGFLVQNQSPNNPGFVMRGITSDSGAATAEPRVSVFQDGVSISKSRGSYVELFDLERIEVAKGPQSTLYGRGALIGAVNIVQNRARLGQVQGYGELRGGNWGQAGAELMFNAPLGDTAALRFAARVRQQDGAVENLLGGDDYNSVDTQAFRLSFGWAPTEALRFDLIANHQTDDAAGTPFKSIAYFPADPATGAVLGERAPWEGAALTPRAAFDGGRDLGLEREVSGLTGLTRWDLSPSLTVNATTAYRRFDSYETFDADGVSLPILTAAEEAFGEQWSQDVRLSFDNGGRFTGFVGAGWFREEGYQRTPTQFDERLALAQLAGLLDGSPSAVGPNTLPMAAYPTVAQAALAAMLTPLGAGAFAAPIAANLKPAHIETATNRSELTSWDVFADATFAVTERLEVSAGLRYTRDDKTTGFSSSVDSRSVLGGLLAIQQGAVPPAQIPALLGALANPAILVLPASAVPLFGLTSQPTANNGDMIFHDSEDDGLTWRLTARYAVSDDVSLYANYARGRRPEVISASSPSGPLGAPGFTPVAAETVDSFEVGAKTALMDRRLRLEGAAYLYNYENFQTTIQSGTSFITTNAGEAESYGFEGQLRYHATASVELFATYGYNRSRFGNGIYEGNSFRLSPDHKASFGALWRADLFGGALEVQPTYTWQSKMFFDDDNDIPALQTGNFVPDLVQDEYQDAYGLLNLRVRFAPHAANWGVEVYGENLLDEQYIRDAGNTGDALGMPTFIAGRPMTWGVSVSLRY